MQTKKQQGKYISVVKGKILDVVLIVEKNQKHLVNFINNFK
jgi:dTDP-4-dehydrorhamnose 3,5-epimerase-like enzyme